MSEKTLVARIEDDLEMALVALAEAETQAKVMERDYDAALKEEADARDMAMRLRRSLLIMQGAGIGSTAWQQAAERNNERVADLRSSKGGAS